MSNSFKKIVPKDKAPETLKKKVMESAENTKLLMEMTELFSSKYIDSFTELFKTDPKKGSNKNENGAKGDEEKDNPER